MNASQARILITLRDGGTLAREICRSAFILRRQDGEEVCKVQHRTLNALADAWGYLQVTTISGQRIYELTDDGRAIARSIRNRVTP